MSETTENNMKSLSARTASVLALATIIPLGMVGPSSAKDHGRTGAAIGGAIIGGAIVSALSPSKVVVEKNIYVPTVVPAPPPAYPTDSFTPGPGVVCYTSQRACYTVGGGYNPQWTWSVFAR
jgi:hypothetical protein